MDGREESFVDDEPDVTFTLKKGLEEEGFQIDIFNDPLEAQSYFKAGQYDMLLLDVSMPKLNGFELYRELKKIDNRVKICFITAFEFYYDEFRRAFSSPFSFPCYIYDRTCILFIGSKF